MIVSRDLINATISRRISVVQSKVLILSEELAKQTEIISFIESILRDRQFRRDLFIVTCRGTAEEFMEKNRMVLEKMSYKQYEMMMQTAEQTSLLPQVNLQDFILRFRDKDGYAMTPYVALRESEDLSKTKIGDHVLAGQLMTHSNNPAQFLGAAVYDNNHMLGTLDGGETRLLLTLKGGMYTMQRAFKDPQDDKKIFTAILRQEKQPLYSFNTSSTPYEIDIEVPLDADISGIQSDTTYVRTKEGMAMLQEQMEETLLQETESLVKKAQEQFGGDIFDFYRRARMGYWNNQDWAKVEWETHFPAARINVTYVVNIRRSGREIGNQQDELGGNALWE